MSVAMSAEHRPIALPVSYFASRVDAKIANKGAVRRCYRYDGHTGGIRSFDRCLPANDRSGCSQFEDGIGEAICNGDAAGGPHVSVWIWRQL